MGVETIAKLLGHANLRTVMRYVHLSQEHLDSAMVRFGVAENRVKSGSNDSVERRDSALPGGGEHEVQ